MKILMDLDDLWEGPHPEIWHGIPRTDLIHELHRRLPQLKITLFASPGLCSPSFLKQWASYDWVELGLHGWYHTFGECGNWTESQTDYCLTAIEKMGYFKKIFRAPQWISNSRIYRPLKSHGWIYAGHHEQVETQQFHDDGGMVYLAATNFIIPGVIDGRIREHGHITEGIANSLSAMIDVWAAKYQDANFEFITDVVHAAYASLPNR